MVLVRLIRNDRGTSAIEFGFIAPLLVLLTVGLIDIGRLALASTSVRYAVAEAARFAIAHGAQSKEPTTDADIKTFAVSRSIGVPLKVADLTITRDPNDDNPGSKVTITATYNMSLILEGFIPMIPTTITRSATMTVF